MRRRGFLRALAGSLFSILLSKNRLVAAVTKPLKVRRVRPSDSAWPTAAQWEKLKETVGGNLINVRSLFSECELDPKGAACLEAIRNVHNPYYIGDQPGGTQLSGWLDAWQPATSPYEIGRAHV